MRSTLFFFQREDMVEDRLAAVLGAWRLWLLGALIGALLAWAAYALLPPDYRARSTVVVDSNLEEAWTYFPDRQLFQFLQRETERLEALAWSDSVIQQVADEVQGVAVEDLRSRLLIVQPGDGAWRFYAEHPERETAAALASAWTQAFVAAGRDAVNANPEMQALRAELNAELAKDAPDQERILELTENLAVLAEQTQGISPYVELSVSQAEDLPVERESSQATYILVGSLIGALLAALYLLLRPAPAQTKS